MKSWTKRILAGGLGLIAATLATGAVYQWMATRRDLAAHPPPGRLVDVGGHRLHVWCTGSGSPVVILDNGLGGSTAGWGFVQPGIARVTRVCSYDRAGSGYSDAGPSPRTAARGARELGALLDRGGLAGPVVLAGASYGGFIVRAYAAAHPERVAGLVLVDAAHEDDELAVPAVAPLVPFLGAAGVLRLAGVSFGQDPDTLAPEVRGIARASRFRTSAYAAAADELMHVRQSAQEMRTGRRRLSAPLVVVTGGRGADPHWRDLQRELLELSEDACLVVAEGAGHVVALEQPQVVVDAILATVEAARGNARRPCPSSPP